MWKPAQGQALVGVGFVGCPAAVLKLLLLCDLGKAADVIWLPISPFGRERRLGVEETGSCPVVPFGIGGGGWERTNSPLSLWTGKTLSWDKKLSLIA